MKAAGPEPQAVEPIAPSFSFSPQMLVQSECGVTCGIEFKENSDDGKRFFHLRKTHSGLARLFTAGVDPSLIECKKRPLKQTNIIEQCMAARDKKFADLMGVLKDDETPTKKPRYSDKKMRAKAAALPDQMSITIAPIHTVPSKDLTVMTSKPQQELWVELSEVNMSYFALVVHVQIQHCSLTRHHPRSMIDEDARVDCGYRGVTYSYSCSRFRVTDRKEGTSHCRVFPITDKGFEETKEMAVQFAKSIDCEGVEHSESS